MELLCRHLYTVSLSSSRRNSLLEYILQFSDLKTQSTYLLVANLHFIRGLDRGCQICLYAAYQNGEKYTK
jgi:hypothetical protein